MVLRQKCWDWRAGRTMAWGLERDRDGRVGAGQALLSTLLGSLDLVVDPLFFFLSFKVSHPHKWVGQMKAKTAT